nr:N-6 DNA methylase [Helicobacter winghamensis]
MRKALLRAIQAQRGKSAKNLIESNLIECIVNLPAKLFLNTQIPACLWFIKRNKSHNNTLFIDARSLGELINRKNRILTQSDIAKITETYHKWQKAQEQQSGEYSDILGFCKSVSKEEIANLGYVLTPGRYVGLAEDDEDFDFEREFTRLKAELESQIKEERILSEKILNNLEIIGGK